MPERHEERILILAPRGRNAELIAEVLGRAEVAREICPDIDTLCEKIGTSTSAVVLCEEAMSRNGRSKLLGAMENQPPWSEIPLIILTSGGKTTRNSFEVAKAFGPRGNITLMERPVRMLTLTSAVRTAVRARLRQYELRDLLASEQAARRQAEAARRQAEAASQAKDHFLATLSHELRTPLNPVLMTVSMLMQDPTIPAHLREDIELVKRNIDLEARLIDDLLDLTRIARNKIDLHKENVDLHTIVEHAVRTCVDGEPQAASRIRMLVDLRATSHMVHADAARLGQVFWNLLRNALKFTKPGGTITVRSADASGGRVQVAVSDTGIGIEPTVAARIFEPFEQGDQAITRQYGGLGLGLAITKKLVDLHKGTITVASAGKDKGSTFTVTLEAAKTEGSVCNESPERPAHVDHPHGLARILVVEDHAMTARVMRHLLKSLQFDVTVAPDVRAAKASLSKARYDLVISDLGLPDGSGLEVGRFIRETCPGPAIAISGYGMEDDIRQTREAGFTDHLVKPIDFAKLEAAVNHAMGLYEPSGGK